MFTCGLMSPRLAALISAFPVISHSIIDAQHIGVSIHAKETNVGILGSSHIGIIRLQAAVDLGFDRAQSINTCAAETDEDRCGILHLISLLITGNNAASTVQGERSVCRHMIVSFPIIK